MTKLYGTIHGIGDAKDLVARMVEQKRLSHTAPLSKKQIAILLEQKKQKGRSKSHRKL